MKNENLLLAKRDDLQKEIDSFVRVHGVLESDESVQVQLVVRKVVITTIPSTQTSAGVADPEMAKKLAESLEVLSLSVRTRNCLEAYGKIRTVGDLLRHSEKDLLSMRSFGRTSLREVRKNLEARGLKLKQ